MSAYHAPTGTVYERNWGDDAFMFVVLDGYVALNSETQCRRAYHIDGDILTCFGANTSWDLESRELK